MADPLIHFFCPYCGIKLSVPSAMAGVSGPCPSCGNPIQAPGKPPLPRFEPRLSPPADSGAPVKPEPRQLPTRPPAEISARPMPTAEEAAVGTPPPYVYPGERRNVWLSLQRVAMLLLFFAASVALVFGVLKFLKRDPDTAGPGDSGLKLKSPQQQKAPSAGSLDHDAAANAGDDSASTQAGSLEPVSPWGQSEQVLEEFLAATSLAERMPLLETRMSEEELAATCLAGPLPKTLRLVPEYRETHRIENRVDCYYTVELEHNDPATRVLTVLVRSRGDQRPRVLAGPFLDSFGGRLAAYAAAPTDKSGTFQVVVYAVASCTDPEIPNREKKLTLKLLASDHNREIARAYFGRQSKINELLENSAYDLNYGTAKACTVLLRWNNEEDPQRPFLEALTIQNLGWDS